MVVGKELSSTAVRSALFLSRHPVRRKGSDTPPAKNARRLQELVDVVGGFGIRFLILHSSNAGRAGAPSQW
ncbi:hypothetical protein SAT01_10660 [Sinomonas atrocyanea]|nr:hypothetical protein SAT01_10660 [Sinomonas atrocyanea]GGG57869.1 hypothetical protein GCM10007172_05890 [Sinomonas atrocyanea]